MIATLVIGLREGLEAALIVGIIAAFLRKNGKSLIPMWIGVALAVTASIAIGVALKLIERDLPQAKQEGMEAIIGAVAVVFVTGMIVWMNEHSRGMKRELEAEAAAALSQGGARSLAVMAFLAVLKEGFETSVFLLATFSAAESARLAATGAVIGIAVAAVIGWGIYIGGVRINLGRFFRATGAFLILVAAGLTVSVLRTAHEAGWLNAGQQKTVDLSWLVQPGTVRSALITGVLGIPADPRLIEVIGWFAYLVPVALYVYWPARLRPRGMAVARLQFGIAAGLAAAAILLAAIFPSPPLPTHNSLTLVSATTTGTTQERVGSAQLDANTLHVSLDGGDTIAIPLGGTPGTEIRAGETATVWTMQTSDAGDGTESITLDQLVTLAGGKIPIGINPQEQPGPFTLKRTTVATVTVWASRGVLLDASETAKTIATISDGGLTTPRTITLPGTASSNWTVSPDDASQIAAELSDIRSQETERELWGVAIPLVLGLAALVTAVAGVRTSLRLRRAPPDAR
ncbi:MAG TPA: iron uptake transporter permease EfeU, partial [Thermomicrobiales bacterium]|nr:iron uptake transporter permease EfeU [Thermomicrobiales bacterium]